MQGYDNDDSSDDSSDEGVVTVVMKGVVKVVMKGVVTVVMKGSDAQTHTRFSAVSLKPKRLA